ncbi:endopeptidase La [Candidatus Gromoviella agglomerans]|uniref:endopeptidase La n=1 Tax=Candidatus Gromoviella agglomerans TaxID=2806609 RepID=UPI001E5ED668|nr:endopeptidase La [Candidatus Gromoviella agglomerans]UFX98253.1 Lon protease [Candidatus Gromoviella agglomerans]
MTIDFTNTKNDELLDTFIYPMIFSRDVVLFPDISVPFFFEFDSFQLSTIKSAIDISSKVFVCAGDDEELRKLSKENICDRHIVGVVCEIKEFVSQGDVVVVLLSALCRAKLIEKKIVGDEKDLNVIHSDMSASSIDEEASDKSFNSDKLTNSRPFGLFARVHLMTSVVPKTLEEGGELRCSFDKIISYLRDIHMLDERMISKNFMLLINERTSHCTNSTETEKILNLVSFRANMNFMEKLTLLRESDLLKRARIIEAFLEKVYLSLQEKRKIDQKVEKNIKEAQTNYILQEQLKAIQEQLGVNNHTNDYDLLEKRIKECNFSNEARKVAQSEFNRLKQMNAMSSEVTVSKTYLEVLLSLPWGTISEDNYDILNAQKILNEHHYGLRDIKNRILEHICVQARLKSPNSSVLCLVGPPGVGKTSICASIAKALNRKFITIALGGVSEESLIRGHRRTYVGAMNGRIIEGIKKCGTDNPVCLFDEIDKLGGGRGGDPESALLEALDPQQNFRFEDHYLSVAYDLSKVMFICTANTMDIKRPLLDRMEVIHLPSYARSEKFQIAKNYLVTESFRRNGINDNEMKFKDDAIWKIIDCYTKESGVRNLSRKIDQVCRKFLLYNEMSANKKNSTVDENSLLLRKSSLITSKNLSKFLDEPIYGEGYKYEDSVGVVNGLAWTEVGGEILKIEVMTFAGKGNVQITGNVGKVMEESVKAARTFVFANALELGISCNLYEIDIHVHMPEAAIPKDGPSAGIAIVVGLVSSLTNRSVKSSVGMTGEVTLHGLVLPIGGLQEKIFAAAREGIKEIIIPNKNEKDLNKIYRSHFDIMKDVKILRVSNVSEVLKFVLN